MDIDWIQERTGNFFDRAVELQSYREDDDADPQRIANLRMHLTAFDYVINRIIAKLNAPPISAGLPTYYPDSDPDEVATLAALLHGVVVTFQDAEEALRPDGPTLAADTLHPWVWDAAQPFWTSGHPAAAVEAAAKSLNAFIQQKSQITGRSDRALMSEVFSSKDTKDHDVRLWFPENIGQDTWRSRQDGLHNLAMGAFAGIRNVAAHTHETGWSETECLEYLGVLSVIARWAEQTERRDNVPLPAHMEPPPGD